VPKSNQILSRLKGKVAAASTSPSEPNKGDNNEGLEELEFRRLVGRKQQRKS
jgi:hypothetical protein